MATGQRQSRFVWPSNIDVPLNILIRRPAFMQRCPWLFRRIFCPRRTNWSLHVQRGFAEVKWSSRRVLLKFTSQKDKGVNEMLKAPNSESLGPLTEQNQLYQLFNKIAWTKMSEDIQRCWGKPIQLVFASKRTPSTSIIILVEYSSWKYWNWEICIYIYIYFHGKKIHRKNFPYDSDYILQSSWSMNFINELNL